MMNQDNVEARLTNDDAEIMSAESNPGIRSSAFRSVPLSKPREFSSYLNVRVRLLSHLVMSVSSHHLALPAETCECGKRPF